jgi:DNA-binding NtrC family response regulator
MTAPSRILIVEDDHDLAENFAEIVEGLGHEVQVAPSAERALELVRETPFHGVITDFRLPGKSGIDFIRELRQSKIAIPVVVVSAFMDFRMTEGAEEAGALDVVSKPVDMERLLGLLTEFTEPGGDVLIVDDNQALAENIAEGLRERGLEPLLGDSGAAALAQRKLPRVAVLDLRLPDRSGIDLAQRLAARDPRIRILFMTGYADELRNRLAPLVDVLPLLDREQPYVVKPFDLGELLERLLQAAERR